MLRLPILVIGLLALITGAERAVGITVLVNTDPARAVLVALGNPFLTHDEAFKIAQMPGNQGVIRMQNEFKIPVTTESFANALLSAAHGRKATDQLEIALYFDSVRPKVTQLLALTKEIDADPKAFQGQIEKRVALFTPTGTQIRLQGYVVAGGDGGGYAFGGTDFYLNLEFMDDMAVARTATTHELYHAVQGAFAGERKTDVEAPKGPQACTDIAHLFADIYEEGSATYVEDVSTLAQPHSDSAVKQLKDINEGLSHLHESATLLELSVIGLSAREAVSFDDVYAVGFYGHGVLYDIGTAMAKAIVENDRPQGLAVFLKLPPYRLVLRYTQLPKYGADKDHPKLDPNTVGDLNQLAGGCKSQIGRN